MQDLRVDKKEEHGFCWGILHTGHAKVRGSGEPSQYLRNYAGDKDASGAIQWSVVLPFPGVTFQDPWSQLYIYIHI